MAGALPLVLIPGHMGAAVSWRLQAADLGRDRPIFIPERHVALASIRAMAVDIVAQLPPAFDLAGWSMGGYIAFELLRLVQERVRKTLLIHTSARPDSPAASAARRALLLRMETEAPEVVFRELVDQGMRDPGRVDAAFREEIVAENRRLGVATLASQVGALIARADARPWLASLPGQFLVVAGTHDTVAPLEAARELALLLPCAGLHVFDDMGHFSPWEKPRELNALMRAFLA